MKVLHYIRDFAHPTETFILDLFERSKSFPNIETKILIQNLVSQDYKNFDNLMIISPFQKWYTRGTDWLKRITFADKILKLINEFSPDIVHAHFGPNGVYISDFLKGTNAKLLISMHGSDATSYVKNDPSYANTLKEISKENRCFFSANSAYLKNHMVSIGIPAQKIKVIYNSVNNEFLRVRGSRINSDNIKIICVGRFVKLKGHKYLLDGLKLLDLDNRYTLTLIGDGPERESMIRYAEKLGISQSINFIRRVEHRNLPDVLREHHIYIQPSICDEHGQEEAFGVSIVEAIFAGLSVIATDTGGLPEALIKPTKFSILINQKSAGQICNTIKEMVRSEVFKENNEEYFRLVYDKFSEMSFDKRLYNYYDEINELFTNTKKKD